MLLTGHTEVTGALKASFVGANMVNLSAVLLRAGPSPLACTAHIGLSHGGLLMSDAADSVGATWHMHHILQPNLPSQCEPLTFSRSTHMVREGSFSRTARTVLQPLGPVPRAAAGVGAGACVVGTVVPTEGACAPKGPDASPGGNAWLGGEAAGTDAAGPAAGAAVGAAPRGNWKIVGMVPLDVAEMAPLQLHSLHQLSSPASSHNFDHLCVTKA